ncbi:MAG: hypothetical protein HYZ27_02605, partial [Deltaproteobacteria bacterium]|nr:hypothetical protein [Deltaproteobacteria bacterium]
DGRASSDPSGQTLTYSWRIASRPSGSTSQLSSTTSSTPTFVADVSGEFLVCLVVTDSEGCSSAEDCVRIVVAPRVKLHIELTWNTNNSDIDVHYRAPNGTFFHRFTPPPNCGNGDAKDVWYCRKRPDWGLNGEGVPDGNNTNDPALDVDNITGFGPENINQDILFDGATDFTIGVHYYCDRGGAATNARIRVFVDGNPVFESTRSLTRTQFWEVANVRVTGNGTSVSVSGLNKALTTVTSPSCH